VPPHAALQVDFFVGVFERSMVFPRAHRMRAIGIAGSKTNSPVSH
jgi:hypothetical protein